MIDTTAQHIATRDDQDLAKRLIAAAEQAHIPDPENFVRVNLGKLISVPSGQDNVTITSVYSYAAQVRQEALDQVPPPPGLNPAAVTDAQLRSVVQHVWNPTDN